jgi:K(+)-stimulated pyrophosphate-energized sodium pump
MGNILYYLIITGFLGLAYSLWKSYQINGLESGTEKSKEVKTSIKKGTLTYLKAEYKFLLLFAVSLGVILYFKGKSETDSNQLIAVSYIVGAGLSLLASYLQLQISLKTSEKVSIQSKSSYAEGFSSAFYGGFAIGLIGVSYVIIGLSGLLLGYGLFENDWDSSKLLNVIAGFALGASSVSLFARMGGGVYAKSSDLSEAYIVKNEPGIVDKSLYNPASYANDSGQNVSNVAGVGSELYEAASISLIAAMILGLGFLNSVAIMDHLSNGPILVPLVIAAVGIFTSIGAGFLFSAGKPEKSKRVMEIAEVFAAIILATSSFFIIKYLLPGEWDVEKKTSNELITTTYKSLGVFWSVFFGIVSAAIIGRLTNIAVGSKSKSVKSITDKSFAGTAGNILGGIEQGYLSTGLPILLVTATVFASHYFAGFYGIGMAAVGMLGNMALQNAINSFAAISDNAHTIAVKSGQEEQTINNAYNLKITGIQALAKGKGFISVSVLLCAIALFGAFIQQSDLSMIDLLIPAVLLGLVLGIALPFVLSSNMISAVGRISNKIVKEVNRQFTEIPELASAKEILDKYNGDLTNATESEKEIVAAADSSADYNQCIEVATFATIWETLIPTLVIIAITALTGYFAGAEVLAGALIGVISGSSIMAIYQSNSGSALESAKYNFEEGVEYNGEIYGKESDAYQSAIIGEKVGKPLKDSASPAMTVLLKVMLVVAIILAPGLNNKTSDTKNNEVSTKQINNEKVKKDSKILIDDSDISK